MSVMPRNCLQGGRVPYSENTEMGHKVPWKIGLLIYLPVTSRPLIFIQTEAVVSPYNFANARLTACILNLPLTPRPMKRRTLSQCPHTLICAYLIQVKSRKPKVTPHLRVPLVYTASPRQFQLPKRNLTPSKKGGGREDFCTPSSQNYPGRKNTFLQIKYVLNYESECESKFRVKYLCEYKCKISSVPIFVNTKATTTRINFSLIICVAMVVLYENCRLEFTNPFLEGVNGCRCFGCYCQRPSTLL